MSVLLSDSFAEAVTAQSHLGPVPKSEMPMPSMVCLFQESLMTWSKRMLIFRRDLNV